MIILIDYHSGLLGNEIAAEDCLALVSISDPGANSNLKAGWRHLLEMEFAHETGTGWDGTGVSNAQADRMIDFCLTLGKLAEPIGLILRCDYNSRRSVAVGKALGQWCDIWVPDSGLRYSRITYQTMCRRIGTRKPPAAVRFGAW